MVRARLRPPPRSASASGRGCSRAVRSAAVVGAAGADPHRDHARLESPGKSARPSGLLDSLDISEEIATKTRTRVRDLQGRNRGPGGRSSSSSPRPAGRRPRSSARRSDASCPSVAEVAEDPADSTASRPRSAFREDHIDEFAVGQGRSARAGRHGCYVGVRRASSCVRRRGSALLVRRGDALRPEIGAGPGVDGPGAEAQAVLVLLGRVGQPADGAGGGEDDLAGLVDHVVALGHRRDGEVDVREGRPRSCIVRIEVELGVGRRAGLVEQLEQDAGPAGRRRGRRCGRSRG